MNFVHVLIGVAFLAAVVSTQDLDDVSFDDDLSSDPNTDEFSETDENQTIVTGGGIKRYQTDEEKRAMIKRVLGAAMKRPGAWTRLGQVLPIVRLMSPPQRLALASLVMAQVLAGPEEPLPPISRSENITSQLMLPIAVDIANMFRGLGRDSLRATAQEYRSRGFVPGTYTLQRNGNGPKIRHPPPTLSGINRRNANYEKPEPYKRRTTWAGPTAKKSPPVHPTCSQTTNAVFCVDSMDYPEDEILKTLKKETNPQVYSALVKDASQKNQEEFEPKALERRQSLSGMGETEDSSRKRQMCSTTVEYARPKKARATSGQWKYIVNTKDYSQTLRLEVCSKIGSRCMFLAEDVASTCEQVYNYHRLLTWDESAGLTMDVFKVPTCCSCKVMGYGGLPFPPHTTPPPVTPLEHPDANLVANDDSPVVRPPPPTLTPPKQGIRVRPYSNPKRRHPVQHRPILPLESEIGSAYDERYPPYDNSVRRITRNHTDTRIKFRPPLLPPTPNQRHPTIPIDSLHAESQPVPDLIPSPSSPVPPPPSLPPPANKRINYSYHPIIDYFRPQVHHAESRVGHDWTPITARSRAMNLKNTEEKA